MTKAALLLVALLGAGSASAQVCAGGHPAPHGALQIFGVGAWSHGDAYEAGLGYAGPGEFLHLEVGTSRLDSLDRSAMDVGGDIGFVMLLNQQGSAALCPILAVGVLLGPRGVLVAGGGGTTADFSETDVDLGVSLGTRLFAPDSVLLVPYAALSYAYASAQVTYSNNPGVPRSLVSESFWIAGFGIGFVVKDRLTVRPDVRIPMGLPDASAVASVTVAVTLLR